MYFFRTRLWGNAPLNTQKATSRNTNRFAVSFVALSQILFAASPLADSISEGTDGMIRTISESQGQIELIVNKSRLVGLKRAATQVSVVNPEIADVQIISPKDIVVTGQATGETTLVIWDEQDRHFILDVHVTWNIAALQAQLDTLFPNDEITCRAVEGAIVVEGTVSTLEKLERIVELAEQYSPNVLNLLRIPGVHQVLLEVRIAELSREYRRALGSNLMFTDNDFNAVSRVGGLITPIGGGSVTLNDAVNLLFGFPNNDLEMFLQALQQKGMLRILAEPNLVAVSGESASFLVGGEFPVPVAQGTTGGNIAITIEWREFGVRLNFTPTVSGEGKIRLNLRPEVSDLDFTSGIQAQGFVIPAVVSRHAETTVELNDNQTFAIAGLLNSKSDSTVRKVPMLGRVPVLGSLFRSSDFQEEETELVMIVTPHLVSPLDPDQVKKIELPGEGFKSPTDRELYLKGSIETETYSDPPTTREIDLAENVDLFE